MGKALPQLLVFAENDGILALAITASRAAFPLNPVTLTLRNAGRDDKQAAMVVGMLLSSMGWRMEVGVEVC